jgi:hypothetical protein
VLSCLISGAGRFPHSERSTRVDAVSRLNAHVPNIAWMPGTSAQARLPSALEVFVCSPILFFPHCCRSLFLISQADGSLRRTGNFYLFYTQSFQCFFCSHNNRPSICARRHRPQNAKLRARRVIQLGPQFRKQTRWLQPRHLDVTPPQITALHPRSLPAL